MRRSPGIWYLAILFASIGLLSIIAWDALRGRSRDRVLALDPSPVARESGNSRSPRSQAPQPKQAVAEPGALPEARIATSGQQTFQQATTTPPVPVAIPPPAVTVTAPVPEGQPIAAWPFATATTTFTRLGRLSGAPPSDGKRSPNCLSLWEPATHMTKEEWKAACERAPRNR